MVVSVLIFGADKAEAVKNTDTDYQSDDDHAITRSTFNWGEYEEMDELELDDLFQDKFSQGNFSEAAWLLMRSVGNGNEDDKIFLSRISQDVIPFVKNGDLAGMERFVPQIIQFFEESVRLSKQQQMQQVILPSSGGKFNFGSVKDSKVD